MRLRQLGSTQSIVFFSSPEVHQSILYHCRKRNTSYLSSHDVIPWLLEQTCSGNEQLQQLYFAQGADFCRRTHAAVKYPGFLTDKDHQAAYLEVLRQTEQRDLEQLYKPTSGARYPTQPESLGLRLDAFMKELRGRLMSHSNMAVYHSAAFEEVEQEKEVAFQIEEIRAVQKPPCFKALSFPGLHPDIKLFATKGTIIESRGYELALKALGRTGLGAKYKVGDIAMLSHLYISAEFMRTIELKKNQPNDDFLVSGKLHILNV
jgi:hypothetical protein